MGRILFIIFVLFACIGSIQEVWGMQIVTPVEGETTFCEISQRDLTIIKTPISNVKAFSGSKNIDVRIEGKNIFVKYTGLTPEPQELVIVGNNGEIYPIVLKPTGIPTETIVLRLRESNLEALEWERSHNYISLVKELIKSMYLETPPRGYAVREADKKTEREGIIYQEDMLKNIASQKLKKQYIGAFLVGEVYTVKARNPITLNEKSLYTTGILAVSINKNKLEPQEETDIYIVRRKG